MTLATTVTPANIATALGQTAPDSGSTIAQQWAMWISDALMLINVRADALNVTDIDQAKVNYVIREAVVDHVRRPDNATQVIIAVDDGSTSKTYKSGAGRVAILDEWWRMLGLAPRKSQAFEVDTMPPDASTGEYVDYSLYYEPGWYPVGSNGEWSP